MAQSKTTQKAGDAVAEAMANVTRVQAAAMGPLAWMGPAGMEAFNATVTEMSDFVSRRLHKDIETQKALLTCKTVDEVQEVQSSAVREAFEDYREETERLSGIVRKFVEDSTRLPERSGKS
jgi:hypothetical protein